MNRSFNLCPSVFYFLQFISFWMFKMRLSVFDCQKNRQKIKRRFLKIHVISSVISKCRPCWDINMVFFTILYFPGLIIAKIPGVRTWLPKIIMKSIKSFQWPYYMLLKYMNFILLPDDARVFASRNIREHEMINLWYVNSYYVISSRKTLHIRIITEEFVFFGQKVFKKVIRKVNLSLVWCGEICSDHQYEFRMFYSHGQNKGKKDLQLWICFLRSLKNNKTFCFDGFHGFLMKNFITLSWFFVILSNWQLWNTWCK